MKRMRTTVAAALMLAPLTLTACSDSGDVDAEAPAVDVSPGELDVDAPEVDAPDVDAPSVEAPDVPDVDVDADVEGSEDGDSEAGQGG